MVGKDGSSSTPSTGKVMMRCVRAASVIRHYAVLAHRGHTVRLTALSCSLLASIISLSGRCLNNKKGRTDDIATARTSPHEVELYHPSLLYDS
ncbi:hypothetical protein O3P69_007919 [Scylla paramamosain]|uniref:Uncharacterized protein n=1 Tax=Scylla paramamosain TaxID=85552 RepID=A0AAW0T0Z0_SCYPA